MRGFRLLTLPTATLFGGSLKIDVMRLFSQGPAGLLSLLCVTALLSGCSRPSDTASAIPAASAKPSPSELTANAENAALKLEVERLRAEVKELQNTPTSFLKTIGALVSEENEAGAKAAFDNGKDKFSSSPEYGKAAAMVSALGVKRAKAEAESLRLKQLGLKALAETPAVTASAVKLRLTGSSIGSRWIFDNYGNSYRFHEASRGEKYVVATVAITSASHDPTLPGVAVYEAVGDHLAIVNKMEYQFTRWRDFGTYLGNSADMGNDFEKTGTINFTMGATISDALAGKPLFVVVVNEGCHTRKDKQFRNPPVFYLASACPPLKPILKIEDFKSGEFQVIKSFNKNKL